MSSRCSMHWPIGWSSNLGQVSWWVAWWVTYGSIIDLHGCRSSRLVHLSIKPKHHSKTLLPINPKPVKEREGLMQLLWFELMNYSRCLHDQAVKLNNDSLNDFLLESANSSDSKEFRDEIKNLNIQKLLVVQHWSYMEKTRKGKVKEIALLSASERIGYYYWIVTQCVENQNFKPNISHFSEDFRRDSSPKECLGH